MQRFLIDLEALNDFADNLQTIPRKEISQIAEY